MNFLVTFFAIVSISFTVYGADTVQQNAKTPTVVGKIVFNGNPMVGVAVQLINPNTGDVLAEAQTAGDGTYDFTGVVAGTYNLKVLAHTSEPKDFKNLAIKGPQTVIGDVDVATGHMLTAPGNFHIIVDGAVYRGARPVDEGQIEWLRQNLKIKTIIDLQGKDPWYAAMFEPGEKKSQRNLEEKWAQTDNQITWINKPLDSVDRVHCGEAQRINHILDIIRDPKNQPVYFHCEHGKDRTGLIAALYETFYEKPAVNPEVSHAEMISDGHNTTFCGAMDSYFDLATAMPMSLHKLDTPSCDQF